MKRIATACALLIVLAPPMANADVTYVFTTISPPGSAPSTFSTQILGLNDDGQLVLSTQEGGLIYQNGTYTSLPAVSGFTVDPEGINDSGEIVGTLVSTSTTGFSTEGFTYQNGSYSVFSPPNSGGQTQARAVNSSGISEWQLLRADDSRVFGQQSAGHQ